MKILATVGAVGLMTFGLTAHASAYSFNPHSQSVTGTGSSTLTYDSIPVNCTADFDGATSSSGSTASVTSATFSGSSTCSSITAENLNWTITPTGASSVSISGVEVKASLPIIGTITCGPSTISASVTQNGTTSTTLTWSGQSLSGGCTTSGSETLTPQITISNP